MADNNTPYFKWEQSNSSKVGFNSLLHLTLIGGQIAKLPKEAILVRCDEKPDFMYNAVTTISEDFIKIEVDAKIDTWGKYIISPNVSYTIQVTYLDPETKQSKRMAMKIPSITIYGVTADELIPLPDVDAPLPPPVTPLPDPDEGNGSPEPPEPEVPDEDLLPPNPDADDVPSDTPEDDIELYTDYISTEYNYATIRFNRKILSIDKEAVRVSCAGIERDSFEVKLEDNEIRVQFDEKPDRLAKIIFDIRSFTFRGKYGVTTTNGRPITVRCHFNARDEYILDTISALELINIEFELEKEDYRRSKIELFEILWLATTIAPLDVFEPHEIKMFISCVIGAYNCPYLGFLKRPNQFGQRLQSASFDTVHFQWTTSSVNYSSSRYTYNKCLDNLRLTYIGKMNAGVSVSSQANKSPYQGYSRGETVR